ncbi:MAG TPA: hypothetical protein VGG75_01975 [Trebonia sp.]
MVAWAGLAGLIISLVLSVQDRRRGIKLDALVLDVATLFFFAVLSVAAFAAPHAPPPYSPSRSASRDWPSALT